MKEFLYRGAVGALMWAATMTRPDLVNAVRTMAKFCEHPGVAQKKVVVKILQYVRRTVDNLRWPGQRDGDGSVHHLLRHHALRFQRRGHVARGRHQLAFSFTGSDGIG